MGKSSRRVLSAQGGVFAAFAVAVLSAGTSLADWPQLRGDAQRTGVTTENLAPPLSLLWRFTGGFQNSNTAAAVVSGDTTYFVTKSTGQQGGRIFALDKESGNKKWSFPVEETGLPAGAIFTTTPTVEGGKVYVGASDGAMYVINAATGEEIIKFNTGRAINSAAVLEDGVLYFGSSNGTVYALDPTTGETAPGWRPYKAADAIISAPLIADTMMIVTSGDNILHGIKRATGISRWRYRLPYGTTPNAMTYGDGSLYVPSGRQLYAIQPASGATRWITQLPEDVLAAPVVAGGVVYIACRAESGPGARLYAVKASNGRTYWESPVELPNLPTAAPVIAGDILYFAGSRGTLLAVARETGKVLWNYRMEASSNRPQSTNGNQGAGGGFGPGGGIPGGQGGTSSTQTNQPREVNVVAPLSLADGTLYVVSNDGTCSAFRADAPDSTGPIVTDQFPKPGMAVSGKPPFIAALKMTDPGSGLDVASVQGTLDGKPIDTQYDPLKNWIYFATSPSGKLVENTLANGRHTITFTARDYMGNTTESTWSFLVDNNLTPTSRTAPVAPKKSSPGTGASGTGTGAGQTGAPSDANRDSRRGGGNPRRGGGRDGNSSAGGGRSRGL
jgi:outer membrane protein assembly factor BamB